MTRLKVSAVLLAAFFLAGCAASQGETVRQQLFGLQADYTALLEFAVAYESRPRCPADDPCSNADIVDKIRASDNAAFAALTEAKDVARDPDATEDALSTVMSAARIGLVAMKQLLGEEGLL